MTWFVVLRWVHILAAAAWFGEVVTINFVLVPAASRFEGQERARFLSAVFPRVFRQASVLSAIAVITGSGLFIHRYHANWTAVWHTPIGTALAIGALMGLALTLFHFFMEPRLGKLIHIADAEGDRQMADLIVRRLRLIPRVGLGVIGSIVLFMMAGARGW